MIDVSMYEWLVAIGVVRGIGPDISLPSGMNMLLQNLSTCPNGKCSQQQISKTFSVELLHIIICNQAIVRDGSGFLKC